MSAWVAACASSCSKPWRRDESAGTGSSTGARIGLSAVRPVLNVSVTNILRFTAIHRVGASRTALYTYLEPFLGALFPVLLLGDRVTLLQFAGGAIIVTAVAFGRPRQLAVAEPGR